MKGLAVIVPVLLSTLPAYAQVSGDSVVDNLGPGQVATVNGERIPESLFRLFALSATQTNPDLLEPAVRNELIERLIILRLFADEAERLGLDRERRIAAELELQRIQLLARHMTERYTEDNPPTTTDLREVYEANLDILSAARYNTRHIVVSSEAEARELLEELQDGEDFAELARDHSTDPSASSGGDLGWITADGVPTAFGDALEATVPGDFYPAPVQTEYGWHLIYVEETESGTAPAFEDIRDELIGVAEAQNLAIYAEELREAADVEKNE